MIQNMPASPRPSLSRYITALLESKIKIYGKTISLNISGVKLEFKNVDVAQNTKIFNIKYEKCS